ncbi:hypothetical protein FOZ60_006536 [Perkinsus olseni]|uniref:Uncharacterized protein n=2 Tax=Perkinsus olseni TaxID=32597 RepID=A0A7J6NNU3_PEROL|nr:hypothetical protein FOZ60_006536 [Perkinsus olseni]
MRSRAKGSSVVSAGDIDPETSERDGEGASKLADCFEDNFESPKSSPVCNEAEVSSDSSIDREGSAPSQSPSEHESGSEWKPDVFSSDSRDSTSESADSDV